MWASNSCTAGRRGEAGRSVRQVAQCDQRVGLAAAVVDGELAVRLVAAARQAQCHLFDQLAQIEGRIGERKELGRILVHRP